MASLRKLLILCGFVASTVAVPVTERSQCARYCSDENDFQLRPGSTYTYDYETTAVTTVQGTSKDKTQLQLTAHADIEVISKCELSLRLRGVQLKLSDPNSPDYLVSLRGIREFAKSLEKHILRFSFQNGQVEHVCPLENVPSWITNIQKGVLSAFQTYVVKPDWTTRTQETDILGKCTAEYHSLGKSWQGMHTVRKMKDLSSCTERENVETYLQGTPYATDFQTRSLPVVKGHQECEQVIGNGFLQSSSCSENLVFRPFSNRGNGVVTTVTQKLIYADTSERTFTGNDYRPTTEPLLYSHSEPVVDVTTINQETETALKELCDSSKDDITISVPRKFSAFVYKLKKLSLSNLKSFYQKTESICPENKKARKFFMDAIPLVNTIESAHFIYEMISRKQVSESESKVWLTSLSFLSDATPDTITAFTPLLDGTYDQAILGISSFIHNFCSSKDCSTVSQVQAAVHKLAENLGENCFSGDERTVILSLKAIGNIGHLFGKENVLKACYKNPQIRTETRLAAIEAFRRVSCDINRDDLLKTYSNYNEDTEIRIAAYLAVMKCPTSEIIDEIKNVLMKEKINHVGSFIWTHMNALAKSKHPERQDIRQIVSNLYLMNKFESDARKFSTAHEATYFLESIDSGLHVDSHLIYSTDSYIPRSAMFNLTVDVFGKTCNLLELDGRLEGLEHIVESSFGPSGYFPQKHVAKFLREKRSLNQNKLNQIENKYNENARPPQQPYGSLDVKIFGTSMWYNQYKHDEEATTQINLLDIVSKLAEEHEKEYSRSFMFLDTTFTIPMTSGLPLKIAVNGTASVGLKLGGKFDVKSFKHVDVLGHIEPSGAVEIASLLTIDAGNIARSGMRVVSTMHSSSVLDGKVEVKNGEVVKVQFNMPRDKIEVFNIESKLFLVHGMYEKEKKSDRQSGTKLESCTGNTFSKFFGVKFCSELELPPYLANTPLHPLNGPARFNIFIEKTDPSLKSYNFDALWKTELKDGAFIKHGILSFNTPNSRINRDVKMELNLNQEDHTASLKLQSPMKKLGLNAKLVNEDFQKKLDFSVTIDEKQYFSMQSDLRVNEEKNGVTYTPFFEIKIPSQKLVSVTGNMQMKYGQKYTAQIQVENLTEKPVLAKVNMEHGKQDRYDVEISLSSFALDGTVKGYTQFGDRMSSKLTADYRIMESKMNKLSIVGKMRNLSANALMKYSGQLNIQASVLPEWNTELQFESMKTTGHIENTFTLSVGDGARSRVHTIKMEEIIRYEGNMRNNKVDASLSLSYPEKRINYGISMTHENTESSLKNNMQIQYDTKKTVKTEVNLKKNLSGPLSLVGELKLKYPGRDTALQAELTESSSNEYRGTLFCQWQEGRQVGVVTHYKNKSINGRFKHEVSGNVNLPNYPQITFSSIVGQDQDQLSGFLETNIGNDKYRVKSDLFLGKGLNHRLANQLIFKNEIYSLDASVSHLKSKLNGNVELKMPNRHRIYAKLEGKIADTLKFGSFETYWDADRDNTKRFILNGELRDQNDGYDGKFNIQFLRRSIKGIFNTGLQGNLFSSKWKSNNKFMLEWSSRDKIAMTLSTNVLLDRSRQQVNNHIELTTPFYGYENVTFSITHLYANQQWDSDITALVPYGNDLSLSSSGKYSFVRGMNLEALAKIQSSFSGYEEMYASITHNHNMNEMKNKIALKWGVDKRIQLQLSGLKQASMFKGTALFNSPFSNYRELSAEVTKIYTSNNYRTKAEFKWTPTKKISINFDGSHEFSGRRRICTVNVECFSPIRGYENTAMKLTYSNDGVIINTDTETSWNRNKVSTSFSLALRNQKYDKNMEGKFLLTSPFRNYENVQITTSLDMNRNSYKFNIDGQLPHGCTASFNSQGKMVSLNDIEINAVAIGQFPKVMKSQRVSLDFVHQLQNSKLRSTFDASIGDDRVTVLLTGLSESNYNSRNIEFSATVNTPLKDFKEMKADFSHNKRGQEYLTKLQINKNSMSASLSHKLVFRDILNFDSTLETFSTIDVLNTKLAVIHASNGRKMEHDSFLLWDNNKKVQLNVQYIDKTFLKEVLLKFTTPFRKFHEVELKSSYEKQDWEHRGIISVVWDRRNKMSLGGKLNNLRWESVNAQLEFLSSFKDFEFYSTAVKYDFTAPQKEIEMSLQWDGSVRKSIIFTGKFLNSYRLISSAMTLTTPFPDFEKISFTKEYSFNNVERNLNVLLEKGRRKVVFNGKTIFRTTSAELSFDLDTPYQHIKDVSASAKFYSLSKGKKVELSAQFGRSNHYETTLQYELQGKSVNGRVALKTPFENFENVNVFTSGSYSDNGASSELSFLWGNNQKITVKSNLYFTRENGNFVVTFESPIKDYEAVTLNCGYKNKRSSSEVEAYITANGKQVYYGKLDSKYGGEHFAKIQLNLNSPYSPFKNVQWIATIDSNSDLYQFLSTLKWEDKETDIHLLLNKKLGQFYEAKMKLNTPFEGFRLLNFESSLRNDRNQFIDGRLILVTPFKALQNLDVYAEYKNDDSGCLAVLKIDTPITLKMEGSLKNSHFKPLLVSLNIEAPFMAFKQIQSSVEANFNDFTNMLIAFSTESPKFLHKFVITSMKVDGMLNFEGKCESSLIPSKTALLSIKFNDGDSSKITGEMSLDALGKAHYISGQFKTVRNSFELLVEADSVILPEGKAQIKSFLNRRRNDKNLEASASLTVPSGSHTLSTKYENKGNQIIANMKVNSDIFAMENEAKFINNNGRDVEARLTVTMSDMEHAFVANLKNYEDEKYIQLKVDCPLTDFLNPLIVTGSLKNEDSTDVSISVFTLNKEVRIAGNMKKIGWENIEALLTINTPFEGLKMIRLDGRFQNDKFENIDCSFQMESSNKIVPTLGITSKYITTRGSEEVSVMVKLPIRNYQNIQLLGNIHYNNDYSSSDTRLTLSLPRNKYSIYGQYGIGRSRVSGRGEIEIDNIKWTASGRLEHSEIKKDILFTVVNPRSESYTFGGAYGTSDNQKQVSVTYNSPRNQRYNLNTSLSYENIFNFRVEFQAETPYYDYKNVQGTISHQTNSQGTLFLTQYVTDEFKDFLKIHHRYQRDGVKGFIQISIPQTNLQEAKVTYGRVKKYTNTEDTLEVDYNRVKQMKMEVILFGEKSSHFVLDVKPLDLTLSADRKQITNGQEIVFKSSRLSRIISFRTSHQLDNKQFLHDAAFSWDEKADKRISYDFRLADTDTGKEVWSRLDTPVRSLMIKGNFTKTSRARSGGVDFYWDAARSLEKHMGVGLMHTDLSSNSQTSHRVQIIVEHPKLSKDIVQTSVITIRPDEFHAKSELDFSRERHYNFLIEMRANDLSRNSRDSHYKAELYLKHPMSRTDIRSSAEVMNSKLESSANIILNTLDTKQSQNVREVRAKIMKLRQEIDLMVISNNGIMGISGKLSERGGDIDMLIERKVNEKKDLTASVKLSRRSNSLDVNIMNDENTGLQISASFPRESVNLKISHSNNGNVITDADMYIGLEQSKILKSRAIWRPRLMRELRISTGETIRAFGRSSNERYNAFISSLGEEWSTRVNLISRSMSELMSPFINDLSNNVKEIANDLRLTRDSFWTMYNRNEFFMQDIAEGYHELMEGLTLGCEIMYYIAVEQLEDIYYTIYYTVLDYSYYMKSVFMTMHRDVCNTIHNIKQFMKFQIASKVSDWFWLTNYRFQVVLDRVCVRADKLIRSYAPCIIDGYYYTKQAADKIRYTVNEISWTAAKCITSNRFYVALVNYGNNVINTIQAFKDFEYAESAQAFIDKYYDMQLMDTIINHPSVEYMSGVANSALRRSIEVYHNLGLDYAISAIAERAVDYAKSVAINSAQELLADFYRSHAGAKYTFAPERGFLSLEFTLPGPRNSLIEVLDFKSYPEYHKMKNFKTMLADHYEDFCIWDYYYKFTKYFTPSYWLPAFRSHALISGNQHYITFDKKAYDFAGKCSYLLARDFVDGNFTAVVNYGTADHMRRSLTILADGRKIDIGNDYKVTLDDVKTECPIQVGHTIVMREGPNVRVDNEKKGFSIVCNFVHNYCSLSVSGFYFGKTAGLFGTFNYEPQLDWMTPGRHLVDDVETFANTWEVGHGVCKSTENYATLPTNDYQVQEKCKALFKKSTSEFRSCFKQVDPEPYFRMCVSDLAAVMDTDQDDAICESAAAYFVECKSDGVLLKMPKHCVWCEKQDGSFMTEGDAIQYPRDGTVKAADVVFLVEEKQCNKDRVKYLSKLAQGIEEAFKHKGYKDIRYSVVGFGGDKIHAEPHLHTMDGMESGPLRSLESALNSLEFGDGPVNMLQAMRYAASLNFRTGTTKSFILVKCSMCQSQEVKAEYSEMLRTLLDGDITLHLLMEQRFEMKNPIKSSKAKRVIGVDSKFAYTLRDVKDTHLPGDGDLLAQLKIPKDVCIPLALEVNGSTFDSQFLMETKRNVNKKFMDVLSRLVTRSSSESNSNWGMCCECLATEYGVGKSTCQRCVSAEMASMISTDLSGVQNNMQSSRLQKRVRKHKAS